MNTGKYILNTDDKETIIIINLTENDKIIFHKKEKIIIKEGDKICTVTDDMTKNKISVISPSFGRIKQIIENKGESAQITISLCEHEMEYNGMCADCGIDFR